MSVDAEPKRLAQSIDRLPPEQMTKKDENTYEFRLSNGVLGTVRIVSDEPGAKVIVSGVTGRGGAGCQSEELASRLLAASVRLFMQRWLQRVKRDVERHLPLRGIAA